MPSGRKSCTKAAPPVTLAGMSTRGMRRFMILYWAGSLSGDCRDRRGMQELRRNQFAIAEAAAVGRNHGGGLRCHLRGRHAGALRGFGDKNLPHLCRSVHDRGAGILHGMAAGGVALIRGQRRVCGDELDVIELDVELFRGNLHERRLDALAELGFAGEYGDRAVRVDADPGVEVRRLLRLPGSGGAGAGVGRDAASVCANNLPADEKLKTSAPEPASTARREMTVAALIRCLPYSPPATPPERDGWRAGCAYGCRSGIDAARGMRGCPPRWHADFSATAHARAS